MSSDTVVSIELLTVSVIARARKGLIATTRKKWTGVSLQVVILIMFAQTLHGHPVINSVSLTKTCI